jgi:hypothetical protein
MQEEENGVVVTTIFVKVKINGKYVNEYYSFPDGTTDDEIYNYVTNDLINKGYSI